MRRERARWIVGALAALVVAGLARAGDVEAPGRRAENVAHRPNVIVVVSDDQPLDALPHDPAVMPYLQTQVEASITGSAPGGAAWTWFPNTFATTPLCCPSRATLLTGAYSHTTGVLDNGAGARLDDGATLATRLNDAGYTTGLVGKYLNGYPFEDRPLVPPGWDRWVAKTNTSDGTVYGGYQLVVDGIPRSVGAGPWTYSTDLLAREAVSFIASAPPDRPFFLWFSPPAPHRPWIPAARHAGAFEELEVVDAPNVGEADVSDKPAWVRDLPPLDESGRERFREDRRHAHETLLALDDAFRSIDDALRRNAIFDETVVLFLTDNGYAFGEHRWETKSCPYEVCIRTPLAVRAPGSTGGTDERLVGNVDVAPTVADLTGVPAPITSEGRTLGPVLESLAAEPWRSALPLEFLGRDAVVPRWRGVRTDDFVFVAYETGERELYDLTGRIGPADPAQLVNRADDPAYAGVLRRLAARTAANRVLEAPAG